MINILYRLSPNIAWQPKNKLDNASKENCLINTIQNFSHSNIIVFGDMLDSSLVSFVKDNKLELIELYNGTGRDTLFSTIDYAISTFQKDEIIYLLEDDFFHYSTGLKYTIKDTPSFCEQLLIEGLEIANYVTLYDHPDKYMTPSPNPYIKEGGENTKVFLTKSTHWKLTNSTVMTFATKVKTLEEDYEVFKEYNKQKLTDSFRTFLALAKKGRKLISSIPGYSTHTETDWLSPLVNWSK
jgi:hypothetical protein